MIVPSGMTIGNMCLKIVKDYENDGYTIENSDNPDVYICKSCLYNLETFIDKKRAERDAEEMAYREKMKSPDDPWGIGF